MQIVEFLGSIKTPLLMIHMVGVIFAMGGALISDYLFSFFSKDKKLNKTELLTLEVLAKIVLYGLIVISISGIMLFFTNAPKYLASTKFLAKMAILVILLLNGYFLNKYIWPHLLNKKFFTAVKERNVRRLAFASGAVSVVSWISLFILGSLSSIPMSVASILGIYLSILMFSILVALVVERIELN